MPEISENSHKISAAQLFCILLLMRVSSELAYPSKGGFGGSGLAAALTAEAVRFLIALPVLIYACKGGGFYAAVWRKTASWAGSRRSEPHCSWRGLLCALRCTPPGLCAGICC